jgi:hypothetical protein
VTFSHSICQSCGPKLYGDLWPERVPAGPPARDGDAESADDLGAPPHEIDSTRPPAQ